MQKNFRSMFSFTRLGIILAMPLLWNKVLYAQTNVIQPGDAIIASSSSSPAGEGVANAIDGQAPKYLNFDSANDAKPSGFVVTPSVGATVIIGVRMQSGNDQPDRDPKLVTVEGSNDTTINEFGAGTWRLIAKLEVPAWTVKFPGNDRMQWQVFYFPNSVAYRYYRWTVLHTQGPSACCMQITEVQFLAGPQTPP